MKPSAIEICPWHVCYNFDHDIPYAYNYYEKLIALSEFKITE